MISLMMAAVVISGVGDRPQPLLGTSGESNYVIKLEQQFDTPDIIEKIGHVIPSCQNTVISAENYSQLNEKDVGNLADFYSHGVIEPAIIEHLEVTGCGKSYRLNIVAQRFVSDNELHFAAIAPGHTLVRIAKQRDAYTAAAFAVGISNKSKGGCGKGVSVYNTEVLTTPANETSSWDEIWYMSNCGVDVPIKVTLKPKATGSSLDVGAVPYN